MSSGLRRRAPWIATGLGLTALYWAADVAHPFDTTDASWFLEITTRARAGDVPYEDFFLGVLPFPLWANAAATWVLGSQIAVQKLLIDATYVATALLAARVALALAVPRLGACLVALASLAFLVLPTASPYSPLSHLFMLVTMAAALAWLRETDPGGRRGRALLAVAGVAAGLSFAGKQTVGAAAVAALLVCLFACSPREAGEWRAKLADSALALGAAGLVVVATVLPVILGGGLTELRYQAFDKGEYIQNSSLSYTSGLETLWELLGDPVEQRTQLSHHSIFLVPPLAALALGAALVRTRRRELVLVAAFLVAAILPALPRAVFFKVSDAAPFCAIAIAAAWPTLGLGRWGKLAATATAVVLAAMTAGNLASRPLDEIALDREWGGLPHHALVPLPPEQVEAAREQAEALRRADGGANRTFVMTYSAGFTYLVSGLENPTAHDYPVLNTMRDRGQEEVIEAIEAGRIERVCLGNYDLGPEQRVERLERWILDNMRPLDPAGPTVAELYPSLSRCVIYVPRAPASAGSPGSPSSSQSAG